MFLKKYMPWVVLIAAALTVFVMFEQTSQKPHVSEINFSDLMAQIEADRIHDVTIAGNTVSGHYKDN